MVIASSMFLASCQNDLEGVKVQETPKAVPAQAKLVMPETVNGRMAFKNEAEFKAFIEALHATDLSAIDAFVAAKGFKSLKAKAELLEANTSETERAAMIEQNKFVHVPDSRFASVLDENAMLQIGGKLYKVTQENLYTADAGQEKAFLANNFTANGIEAAKVHYQNPKPSAEARVGDFWGWLNEDFGQGLLSPKNGRATRAQAEIWNVYYPFLYGSVGARTTMKKDVRIGGWLRTEAYIIGVTAEGVASEGSNPPEYQQRSDIKNYTAEREVTPFHNVLDLPIIVEYFNTTHNVVHDANHSVNFTY